MKVNVEPAAIVAYQAFVAANPTPRTWDELPEHSKMTWRRVAAAVLGHAVPRAKP